MAASGNGSGAWIITVGRSPDNTLIIDHPGVSAHHAQLRVEGNTIVLEDLNSSNGTYVNGKKIIIHAVSRRDLVTFGQHVSLDWQEFEKLLASARPIPFDRPVVQTVAPSVPVVARQSAPAQPAPQSPAQSLAPGQARPNAYAGLGSEMAFALHANKSFTGKAFLSLLLYYVGFWFLGFISNIIFLSDANRTKRLIGSNPPGYGCLTTLLVVHIALPLLILMIILGLGIHLYR
ncbi:MAG TPA: FHA domain-containing protein [bacterium]|nr:FHA domain-containing protein [bacterium]HQI50217.1 FHA domain-containing protein [bacterium]HQJ65655.1 FHA domain-containing protein [bacterium]